MAAADETKPPMGKAMLNAVDSLAAVSLVRKVCSRWPNETM